MIGYSQGYHRILAQANHNGHGGALGQRGFLAGCLADDQIFRHIIAVDTIDGYCKAFIAQGVFCGSLIHAGNIRDPNGLLTAADGEGHRGTPGNRISLRNTLGQNRAGILCAVFIADTHRQALGGQRTAGLILGHAHHIGHFKRRRTAADDQLHGGAGIQIVATGRGLEHNQALSHSIAGCFTDLHLQSQSFQLLRSLLHIVVLHIGQLNLLASLGNDNRNHCSGGNGGAVTGVLTDHLVLFISVAVDPVRNIDTETITLCGFQHFVIIHTYQIGHLEALVERLIVGIGADGYHQGNDGADFQLVAGIVTLGNDHASLDDGAVLLLLDDFEALGFQNHGSHFIFQVQHVGHLGNALAGTKGQVDIAVNRHQRIRTEVLLQHISLRDGGGILLAHDGAEQIRLLQSGLGLFGRKIVQVRNPGGARRFPLLRLITIFGRDHATAKQNSHKNRHNSGNRADHSNPKRCALLDRGHVSAMGTSLELVVILLCAFFTCFRHSCSLIYVSGISSPENIRFG